MPRLEEVLLLGTGSIRTTAPFTTVVDRLYLGIRGFGRMNIESETRSLGTFISGTGDLDWKGEQPTMDALASITGSGNITLSGSAPSAGLTIEGTGNIIARDFEAPEVAVDLQGTGDVYTAVSRWLDVRLLGTGNVYYYGSPTTINRNITGTGEIIQQ